MNLEPIPLGQQFGNWTTIEELEPEKSMYNGKLKYIRRVKCKCICGTIRNVNWSRLKNGKTNSCGCIGKVASKNTWSEIIQYDKKKQDTLKKMKEIDYDYYSYKRCYH